MALNAARLRRGTRMSAGFAAVLASLALGAQPIGATAAPPAWSPDAPTWSTALVTHKDLVMDDGIVLRANVGIPTSLTTPGVTHGERFPVLLSQTPYRKDGGLFSVDPYFVGRGFVSMVIDVRGTGTSGGEWESFSAREQADGPQILHWIEKQSWYDSQKGIGLLGASYLAINQLLTLEQDPGSTFIDPASHGSVRVGDTLNDVKAIFPVVPMSDSYRDVTFHGGNLDAAFMVPWLGLVTALGIPPGNAISQGDPSSTQGAINVTLQHLQGAGNFQVPTAGQALTGGPLQFDGPFSWERSPLRRIKQVHVPTFVVGGEFDIFQRGEPLLYQALDVPYKKLVLGPWIHLQGSTASTLPADGLPDLKTLQLAWFEHYLKGVNTGIDSGPQVYQYELTGTAPSHFVASQDYPLKPWSPSTLYLNEGSSGTAPTALHDGILSPHLPGSPGSDPLPSLPASSGCSRTTFQWGDASAAQVGIGNAPCETDQRVQELTELTYTTMPATAPITIDGPINVHLVADSPSGGNITFTVHLTDVAPDGTSTQLSAGWLLASMRAEGEAGAGPPVTLAPAAKLLRVYHPFTADQPTTTALTDYNIEVFPTFATFQAGHRVRLDIGTGDTPHIIGTAPHEVASAGSVFNISRDPAHPSYVTLPTMGGAVLSNSSFAPNPVTAAAGTGGTLPTTAAPRSGLLLTGALMLLCAVFMGFLMLGPPRWPNND